MFEFETIEVKGKKYLINPVITNDGIKLSVIDSEEGDMTLTDVTIDIRKVVEVGIDEQIELIKEKRQEVIDYLNKEV